MLILFLGCSALLASKYFSPSEGDTNETGHRLDSLDNGPNPRELFASHLQHRDHQIASKLFLMSILGRDSPHCNRTSCSCRGTLQDSLHRSTPPEQGHESLSIKDHSTVFSNNYCAVYDGIAQRAKDPLLSGNLSTFFATNIFDYRPTPKKLDSSGWPPTPKGLMHFCVVAPLNIPQKNIYISLPATQ